MTAWPANLTDAELEEALAAYQLPDACPSCGAPLPAVGHPLDLAARFNTVRNPVVVALRGEAARRRRPIGPEAAPTRPAPVLRADRPVVDVPRQGALL